MFWNKFMRFIRWFLIIVIVLFLTFPIFLIIISSLRPYQVMFSGLQVLYSTQFTFEYYSYLNEYKIPLYLFNSLFVSLTTTLMCLVVSILGGYSLSRFRFPGLTFCYALPLIVQLIPETQILIPMYITMLTMNLLNTHVALILALITLGLPRAVWLMASYLKTVPVDLEEAALVDGCSRIGVIWRILIPVIRPGIAVVTVLTFLGAWGEFMFPYVLINSKDLQVLPQAIFLFLPTGGEYFGGAKAWGMLFASSIIYMSPAITLFALLQPFVIKGLTVGSVKR